MNETILTWNVRNWLTVVLMVTLGWLLVMLAWHYVGKLTGGKIASSDNA